MSSIRPYYRRPRPEPQKLEDFAADGARIDMTHAHFDLATAADPVAEARRLFDVRAAAMVRNDSLPPVSTAGDLLERKTYDDAPDVLSLRKRSLGLMAFADYFPGASEAQPLRDVVSLAIMGANPGWCGTFGPGVDAATDLIGDPPEGNYDMGQMYLVSIVYRYYDELTPAARERLIYQLLASSRIHRPRRPDTFTSGGTPNDWTRAGFVSPLGVHLQIGETENHILTILTARYLTNQLLYQRNPSQKYDNRRNGYVLRGPDCTDLLLSLLRNILRGDFSEYNAKNYQTETRWALLNLCSYAYDHEVRLAARMVLDYVSAQMAVSSNDLRRMLPFRRRNEGKNVTRIAGTGFMDVGLLESSIGADPMVQHFAVQAGNLRAFEAASDLRPWPLGIRTIGDDGNDATIEGLCDYRLPTSIHDLLVNDRHRRFFQILHRTPKPDEAEGSRFFDNMEILAGSPSYLITAGGNPDTYALDPGPLIGIPVIGDMIKKKANQQLGVAVTTSFMPTGRGEHFHAATRARDLIQFSVFSDEQGRVENYGVAPDFACGHVLHMPRWIVDLTLRQAVECLVELGLLSVGSTVSVRSLMQKFKPPVAGSVRSLLAVMCDLIANSKFNRRFLFIDKGSSFAGRADRPGFYLAIFKDGNFAAIEAFDTWLHPELTFKQFKQGVLSRNGALRIKNNVEARYTTQGGTRIAFKVWNIAPTFGRSRCGALVTKIDYGAANPADGDGDAQKNKNRFLAGTVINSRQEAVIEIKNRFLGTRIVLDMRDKWHPKRTAETGEVEAAGSRHEVWVDFDWTGPSEGDFFRPFKSIGAAVNAVADGGVVKIVPGSSKERPFISGAKRFRMVAASGGVTIGAH